MPWSEEEKAQGFKKLEKPYPAGIAMALGSADGKVHGRLMGRSNQCLQLHPDAHMLDSWCVLAYPHEGQEHEYNQEPAPRVPDLVWPWEMPA